MFKMEELRSLSIDDLKHKYDELSREIFELTNELRVTRKIEQPHRLKLSKKDRARVMTALSEKRGENE